MLPVWLKAQLDERLQGVARTELAARARSMSEHYRRGDGSVAAIRDDLDVLAYAVARMPATFAAVSRALSLSLPHFDGFAPTSLLDLGAGPGGSTFAALEALPGIAQASMIETNPHFRKFAARLISASTHTAEIYAGDLATDTTPLPPSDLVLASYVLAELPAKRLEGLVERALGAAQGLILIRRAGNAGRLSAHPSRARCADRKRLRDCRALSRSSSLPDGRGRLVSFYPTPAAVARPHVSQSCHSAVRGRALQLRRCNAQQCCPTGASAGSH